MPSQFENLSHPDNASAVTPSDSSNLTNPGILYVGGAGDLSVVTAGGNTVSLVGVSAGSFIPLQIARVNATGTDATNILVLF